MVVAKGSILIFWAFEGISCFYLDTRYYYPYLFGAPEISLGARLAPDLTPWKKLFIVPAPGFAPSFF